MNYPEMCYVYVEVGMEIGLVKWGESGYYRTEYESNSENEELVKKLNAQLGVSDNEAEAMKILSMNNVIEGNSEKWKILFEDIITHIKEKEQRNECK